LNPLSFITRNETGVGLGEDKTGLGKGGRYMLLAAESLSKKALALDISYQFSV